MDTLFGTRDENLKLIEHAFGVRLRARGNRATVEGDPGPTEQAEHLLSELSALAASGHRVRKRDVETAIRVLRESPGASLVEFFGGSGSLGAVGRLVTPRSLQ